MTFTEYLTESNAIEARGKALIDRLGEQARTIGETRAGTGRDYAFHLAHNWHDLTSLSEAQRAACREILRLESRIHRIWGISANMRARLWDACGANPRSKAA